MSEQSRIHIVTATLYSFPRPIRHQHGSRDEAVTVDGPTLTVARSVYRNLRAAGEGPVSARLDVWLMLIANGRRVTIERHAA